MAVPWECSKGQICPRTAEGTQTHYTNNITGPVRCEAVPVHSMLDAEPLIITQLKHLLNTQKNYLDNDSLEYPEILSPAGC